MDKSNLDDILKDPKNKSQKQEKNDKKVKIVDLGESEKFKKLFLNEEQNEEVKEKSTNLEENNKTNAPKNIVEGISNKILANNSTTPVPIRPHGSIPSLVKISTESGWPVNLKYNVCNRIIAEDILSSQEIMFLDIDATLLEGNQIEI